MANPYISSVSFGNQPNASQLAGALQPQIDFNAYGMGGSGSGAGQPQQSQGGGLGSLLQNKAVGKLINKGLSSLFPAAAPTTYGSLGALGGTPSGLGQYGSLASAAAPADSSLFGLGGGLSAPVAEGSLTGVGASLAPAEGAAGTYGSLGALGGSASGLGTLGSLGTGGGAAAPAFETAGYAVPDSAAAAGSGAGSFAAMAGPAIAGAVGIADLISLYQTLAAPPDHNWYQGINMDNVMHDPAQLQDPAMHAKVMEYLGQIQQNRAQMQANSPNTPQQQLV